jgi:hypothetical protein
MITIKDIYQWYNNEYTNSPKPPSNLTPIQKIEWDEQNSLAVKEYRNLYRNKSFIGELLSAAPAVINSITKDRIMATGPYIQIEMNSYIFTKKYYEEHSQLFTRLELKVSYDIIFDDSFYETVKLMYNGSMVELEGIILNFSREFGVKIDPIWDITTTVYNIQLKLSRIKQIKKENLYSNLLNDSHHFYSNHKNQCFIATAAFGNQDITEVIQLREFRDNVLRNSIAGRCFISTYIFLSPPIALVIRQSNWLRKVTRTFLKKVVLPLTKISTSHLEK